jgi:protein TonB
MNVKKNPKANLENKRNLFFLIGLVIALSVSYSVLEYKSPAQKYNIQNAGYFNDIIDDFPPITKTKELKKPKPIAAPDLIEVVPDKTDILIELDIPDTESWEDDSIDEPIINEPEEDEAPVEFRTVEDLPLFPGYENLVDNKEQKEAFMKEVFKHVKKHFRYPEIAKEMGIEGRVFVHFIIEKDGSIKNVIVARGVDKSLDNEAIRIVNKLPKLTPAKQRKVPVRVSFILPITFRLQ